LDSPISNGHSISGTFANSAESPRNSIRGKKAGLRENPWDWPYFMWSYATQRL
jgi:hypothetical protein